MRDTHRGLTITDALYGEHGPLYALFGHLEESAPRWELADLLLAGRCLEAALLSHAQVEDDLLFPLAEELVGREELERLCQSWADRRGVSVPVSALP